MKTDQALLRQLLDDEFVISLGYVLPPAAMRLVLRRHPLVKKIRLAIRHGALAESDVTSFAADVTAPFQPGARLPGDLALAALAVALEDLPADFAEEYLYKLAGLRLAEMTNSIRVARECLVQRFSLPKNETRISPYSRSTPAVKYGQVFVMRTRQLSGAVRALLVKPLSYRKQHERA